MQWFKALFALAEATFAFANSNSLLSLVSCSYNRFIYYEIFLFSSFPNFQGKDNDIGVKLFYCRIRDSNM